MIQLVVGFLVLVGLVVLFIAGIFACYATGRFIWYFYTWNHDERKPDREPDYLGDGFFFLFVLFAIAFLSDILGMVVVGRG